ncbi:MAG TPA: phage head closure protein [Rhizobiaceae bacterium]|nr:phage head closure protein [Rhizobiaceae bacterium]
MPTLFLDPGRLRDELRLEAPVDTPDGLGGATRSWVEVRSLFGFVEPVSASAPIRGDGPDPVVTHRIFVRRAADIDGTMRLRKGDRIFSIFTVSDPDESGRYLLIEAEEAGR